MKKKLLLLTVLIMALVCLLAISVSAAEPTPSYKKGEWIFAADGTTKLAIRDTEGNPLIWYMNGEELKYVRADQTDESKEVYVKYNISGITSSTWGWGDLPAPNDKCLKDIDIYDNGTQIECSGKDSALVLFNMEKLDIEAINSTLWGNKNGCFTKCRGIVFPSTLKYVGQEGITATSLVQVWNFENTKLEFLTSCEPFATSTFTQEATNGVLKMPATLNKPMSVQKAKIRTYIMNPDSTYNHNQLWHQYFRECAMLEKVMVPAQVSETGFGSEAWRGNSSTYLVMFTGTQAQAQNLRDKTDTNHNGTFSGAELVSYTEYLADSAKYDNSTNKVYIIYDTNYCYAFRDSVHDANKGTCAENIDCKICNDRLFTTTDGLQHKLNEKLTYSNGIGEQGLYECECTNTKYCTTKNANEIKAPIITARGYSVALEGGLGIDAGFTIDKDLLNEYNTLNGAVTMSLAMVKAETAVNVGAILNGETMNLEMGVSGIAVTVSATSDYSA
ncbi:MAG: hypothetical protein J6A54_03400, partial [Clostridia bacterium]|nr:hypothetical protein [Clostridia bacterium]